MITLVREPELSFSRNNDSRSQQPVAFYFQPTYAKLRFESTDDRCDIFGPPEPQTVS
jgi:hypothetical protein